MRGRCFLTLALAFCGELLLGGVLHAQPANLSVNIIYPAAGALTGHDRQVVDVRDGYRFAGVHPPARLDPWIVRITFRRRT